MTEANQKRLYEHYKATKQEKNIEMMEKAYPHFKAKVKVPDKKSGANVQA